MRIVWGRTSVKEQNAVWPSGADPLVFHHVFLLGKKKKKKERKKERNEMKRKECKSIYQSELTNPAENYLLISLYKNSVHENNAPSHQV